MKFINTIIISVILIICTGCFSNSNNKYDYSKLENIATNLKEVHSEMQNVLKSEKKFSVWYDKKDNILSQLSDIQIDIDVLPPVEKEKKDSKSEDFNNIMYSAREIANKLQDIQYLLYDASNTDSFEYFEAVASDEIIQVRLDNLIERCQKKGLLIPLPAQYKNILPPETDESIDIEIEQTSI